MTMRKDISIDKSAVSRAARAPLKAYYIMVQETGYDGSTERPGNWDEEEALFKALTKSKYVTQSLDWEYVVELIYAVLDHNPPLTSDDFAEKLEELIVATAKQRDYLAIFPLCFTPEMSHYIPGKRESVVKDKAIGKFIISPSAPTVEAFNRIILKHGFSEVDDSDFQHAMRTTRKALSSDMLVTFDVHGAIGQLRLMTEIDFTFFRRLVEVFGVLFGKGRHGFGKGNAVQHFFLLSKTSGELSRFPTRVPSLVNVPLDNCLFEAIGRPSFNEFLSKVSSSHEPMYGRIKNAIKFFSMALNSDDKVSSFLFYVISMESIFSRDKHSPIKVTLADFGALLCFPPAQRLKAHQRFRDAYDLRSAMVHNGISSVSKEHVKMAMKLAARAIYASLFLCKQLENTSHGKLEDRFFNYLRDQKLGLVKAIRPRDLWALPEIDVSDA